MVNVRLLDKPPPPVLEAGLKTVTVTLPVLVTSLAAIAALICVWLINVVVRLAPFQRTTAPFTKLLPLTCNVNAALPAAILPGIKLTSTGTGLG